MRFRAYSTVRYWPLCQSNAQYDKQVLITSAVEEIQEFWFCRLPWRWGFSHPSTLCFTACHGNPQTGRNSDHNCCFLTGSKIALQKLIFSPVKSQCFFFPFIARATPLKQQRAVAMMCICTQRFEKRVRKIEVMVYFDAKLYSASIIQLQNTRWKLATKHTYY